MAPTGEASAAKRPPNSIFDDESSTKSRRVEIGEEIPDEVTEDQIAGMLDQADDVHIEAFNEGALKRMVLQLGRKIKTNQELRILHVDEPEKFMGSEASLDDEIKRFTVLATHPDLYGEFISLDGLSILIGLLNHANTDISVSVFQVLSELTDADVIAEVPEPEAFVQALFDAELAQMSTDVLLRIDEDASDEDAQAVQNCLGMIENLADITPTETCTHFAKVAKLLPWLIKRVRHGTTVDYNRVYASEILGILLQNSEASREAMVKLEGVDKILRGIAAYRKKDPENSEESEFVQNMFDSLCSLMLLPAHQIAFGKVQGLELMIRMMRERIFVNGLALRLAAHALRHCPENCQIFVDKLGLKVLFAMFMKQGPKAKTAAAGRESEEHVTSIIQSLCRYCTGTAVARVLNKFVENRFEKLERLLEMHEEYARSVKETDAARSKGEMQSIDRELEVDDEEQLFLDRCDAGLFTLQQVDITLVRLANMGNRQASDEIGKLMDAKGVPLAEVSHTLEEYCQNLGESAKAESDEVRSFLSVMTRRNNGEVAAPAEKRPAEKKDKKEKREGGDVKAADDKRDDTAPVEERRHSGTTDKKKTHKHTKDRKEKRSDSSDGD